MSIKTALTKNIRKILPAKKSQRIADFYRKSRINFLSAAYRNPAKDLKIIAITGTNGKTTTANYINAILKEAGLKTALFSTAIIEMAGKSELNNLNLTTDTTAHMQKFFTRARRNKVDYVIIEAPSQALDQHKLDKIPIYMAIMTNLTEDHIDYHKTMDVYAAAKSILFQNEPPYIILNHDDAWFEYFNQFSAGKIKVTYGQDKLADICIKQNKLYKKGTEATLVMDKKEDLEVATHLPGEFNAYNMAAAVAAASLLDINPPEIQDGLASLESLPGRFERVANSRGLDIVVDYAHTPDGLERLLKSAKAITSGRIILVFGSMGERDRTKRPIMGRIAAENADLIYVTDEENDKEPRAAIRAEIIQGMPESDKIHEVEGREQAIKQALAAAKKDDIVLVTGLGHETYRLLDGKRISWSDQDIIRQLLN